jgi:prepilin-type N-terminal cleavage/methylation domain-containing protein
MNQTIKKGFTLIEAVVAIFLISVGVVGFFSFFEKVINYNSIISSRLIASYLAQEGMEIVRNVRDSYWLRTDEDWDSFRSKSITECLSGCEADYKSSEFTFCGDAPSYLKIDDDGFYSYTGNTETKFKRKIMINTNLSDLKDPVSVAVEVSWTEKGQSYNFSVREILYKWWNE